VDGELAEHRDRGATDQPGRIVSPCFDVVGSLHSAWTRSPPMAGRTERGTILRRGAAAAARTRRATRRFRLGPGLAKPGGKADTGAMGRPGRTLLIIGVMAVICVAALMGLANRYGKVLEQRSPQAAAPRAVPQRAALEPPVPPPPPARPTESRPAVAPEQQAQELVAAFLAVRAEVRAALDGAVPAGPAERLATLERARERALGRSGLDLAQYRQVRSLWRGWRERGSAPTPAFTAAFTAQADRLDAADLGEMEPYD
jgi:hypothetical protein